MEKIIVKIESADGLKITAKALEDKWNYRLLQENQIKVTEIEKPLPNTNELRDKFENWYHINDEKSVEEGEEIKPSEIFNWFMSELSPVIEDQKWINVKSKTPPCYQSGHWDGLKSDRMLVYANGETFSATAYEGFLDGSKYLEFYDFTGLELNQVTHWMPLPSPPKDI